VAAVRAHKFVGTASMPKPATLQPAHDLWECPARLHTRSLLLRQARIADLPMVVDGDALFLVAREPDLVRGYANCILTPNLTEYRRLAAILGVSLQVPGSDRASKLLEVGGWVLERPCWVAAVGMWQLQPWAG
jgi:hypothetical protein